jgi:hypothetical protein
MKQKWLYWVLFFVFTGIILPVQGQSCTKVIDNTSPYIDWNNSAFHDIGPGDTVCLQAGNWDYIQLKGFHGTADQPIVFINYGGAVIINTDHFVGIKIGGCSHILFTGTGDPKIQYGFSIQKVSGGAGMGIDDFSTDIEVEHVEISHTKIGGVYAKTDPTCNNFGATRDKFVMRNFSFHDNWVHDVADEGLYIGNSHYAGLDLQSCDTTVYPHVLKGVYIYHNLIENTGWDGIQVSSADSGCFIHDNQINFDSQAGISGQMSGILIGGGSICKTYNNKISNGKGDGIDIFGQGNFDVFNNLIVNAGQYYLPNDPNAMKHGIYLGKVITLPNAVMGIYNNTIISPKSYGMYLSNDQLQKVWVKNNLIVNPGRYATEGNDAFIHVGNMDQAQVSTATNYENGTVTATGFIDPDAGNYDLQPTSPAVNTGTNLTEEGITFDILNRSRPFGSGFDIGAYECHDPSLGISSSTAPDIEMYKAYPVPTKTKLHVWIRTPLTQTAKLVILDMSGKQVMQKMIKCTSMQNTRTTLPVRKLKSGLYQLVLFSQKGISSFPFIIQK